MFSVTLFCHFYCSPHGFACAAFSFIHYFTKLCVFSSHNVYDYGTNVLFVI